MTATMTLYRSSIGKKVIMAITGVIGYAFVIGHMIGNFKIFFGAEAFNHYAEFLRTFGEPLLPARTILWIIRLTLLAAVTLHVVAAIQLTRQDQASRPVRNIRTKRLQANFASLTLRWGGIAIFLFIVYHLLHITFGVVHPDYRLATANGLTHPDAYHNVVTGFQNPLVVLVYLLAMVALAMHLYHGVWSMFHTLGLNSARTNMLFRGLAVLSAVLLFVGFSVVPVSVVLGIVQ